VKALAVFTTLTALTACANPAPPQAPSLASKPVTAPLVAKLCADWVLSSHGPICQQPVSNEEQAHRQVTFRLWYRDDVVEKLDRINGRGFPEPDDYGCYERRYRFEAGYVAEATGFRPDGTICSRVLFSERASRASFVDAWGRPDFKDDRAYTAALYERDDNGVVVRMRPLASDGSPSTIEGAAEVRYERDARFFETRRCFFDAAGKPTGDYHGVHCFVQERDSAGNAVRQTAWSTDGKPMAGAAGVHAWVWAVDAYGNRTRQTRLGLDGQPASSFFVRCVSFEYQYDSRGFRTSTSCLDAHDRLTEFDQGNSRWVSTPDARGRTRETRYFDRYGSPLAPAFGFARVEMDHDELGHITEHRYFLVDGAPGQKDGAAIVRHELDAQHLEVKRSYFDGRGAPQAVKGCATQAYTYDQHRDLVRQACLDGSGNPAMSRDRISISTWSYDAQGRMEESSYVDPKGALADSRAGYARRSYTYDARGADKAVRHFKADGRQLSLRRFSVLWVHPPYSDGFWPAPSRAAAVETIETARRELLGGLPWASALARYGDEKWSVVNPGDVGYLNLETIFPVARAAIESLEVGEYSRVVEMPFGLALYLRTE
jgi:hypothetical protein